MNKHYDKIDRLIENLWENFSLAAALYPINFIEEKRKFFDNPNYNPQFIYKVDRNQIDSIRKEFSLLKFSADDYLGSLYEAQISKFLTICKFVDSIGQNPELFSSTSLELYPIVDSSLDQQDLSISKYSSKSLDFLHLEEIIDMIKNYSQKFEFPVNVEVTEQNLNSIRVTTGYRIIIPRNIKRRRSSVLKMLRHEIDVHLRRYYNGSNTNLKILKLGTAGYLKTEEGLAILMSKDADPNVLRNTKLLQYAIELSQKCGFREIYDQLLELDLTKNFSWNLCYRVKRGLSDSSRLGGYTKDQYYNYYKYVNSEQAKYEDYLEIVFIGKSDYQTLKNLINLNLI